MTFIFLSVNKIIMQIHILQKALLAITIPITYELINTRKYLIYIPCFMNNLTNN